MQTSLPPGGRIAQSVEQGTENPRVPSSILGPATIFFLPEKLKFHFSPSRGSNFLLDVLMNTL